MLEVEAIACTFAVCILNPMRYMLKRKQQQQQQYNTTPGCYSKKDDAYFGTCALGYA